MSFESFELDPSILRAIDDCGFETPSEIQAKAIPFAMDGRDLMASAPTGTGKTAAFVLPALHKLILGNRNPAERAGNRTPRVLVLTPTRELANQIAKNTTDFSKHARLYSTLLVGGVPYPAQIKSLKRGVDMIIATPGRLIDHMKSDRIDFSAVELLILDEADRMLDMGFLDDVKKIAAATPENRQTLLFSATLEGEIQKVAQQLLKNPEKIQVAGVKEKHDSITQYIHQADDFRHKMNLLRSALDSEELDQAIIFTATKKGADDMASRMREDGHNVAALHGDLRMSQRLRVVERMQKRNLKFLVATDVAARGLDVKGITHVINFDLPMAAEDYIHRIGRTGRGGNTGTAISLVGPNDWEVLNRIEKLTGQPVERRVVDGMEPTKPMPSASKRPARGRGNYRNNNAKKNFSSNPRHGSNDKNSNRQGHGNGERSGVRNSNGNAVKVTYSKSSSQRRSTGQAA
ncbi:MAG: DEAD/DEAH box helicase [Gammaproteobacteria bacterium]|nr:DEAD/DEAH box helicase [Gammaproteobacteria bacterium]